MAEEKKVRGSMRGEKVKDKEEWRGRNSDGGFSFRAAFRSTLLFFSFLDYVPLDSECERASVTSRRAPAQLSDSWTRRDHVECNGATGTTEKEKRKENGRRDGTFTYGSPMRRRIERLDADHYLLTANGATFRWYSGNIIARLKDRSCFRIGRGSIFTTARLTGNCSSDGTVFRLRSRENHSRVYGSH